MIRPDSDVAVRGQHESRIVGVAQTFKLLQDVDRCSKRRIPDDNKDDNRGYPESSEEDTDTLFLLPLVFCHNGRSRRFLLRW